MEINTKYEMGQKVYRARVIKRTFEHRRDVRFVIVARKK